MKKMLALLLAAVMCLSLAACGGGQSSTDNNSAQEQQTGTSTNDHEVTEADVSEPENTEPQYETVALTLENWDEYFEITNDLIFAKNEFDEIWRIDCNFYLELKPEYIEKCLGADDFAIKIAWTSTSQADAAINYEDETYELTEDLAVNTYTKFANNTILTDTGTIVTSFYQEEWGYFLHYPYDFEVTQIKGQLYIATDDGAQ